MPTGSRALFARLFNDDSGQDLVEYALLTAVVGLAGAVAAPLVGDAVDYVYGTWVTETNSLWVSPDPAGS
jgi:Flp pilus assembly pilin Flp